MRARIWLRFSGLSAYGSLPSRLTCPELGLRRPPAVNSNVVFPQPLGPRTAKNSPGETDKQTLSRAVTLPSGPSNHLLIFLNSSILLTQKFEIRNPKHETISKFECPNDQNVLDFEFVSFEFVSNFGFRYSDLILLLIEWYLLSQRFTLLLTHRPGPVELPS